MSDSLKCLIRFYGIKKWFRVQLQKCPFEAISIINLPSNLEKDTTHRYSANSFKLHRLPTPRPGEVLGLVGTNGIGKSTALKILAGKQKPNLGRFKVRYCVILFDNSVGRIGGFSDTLCSR